jgi:S1-C subfamily serine protease
MSPFSRSVTVSSGALVFLAPHRRFALASATNRSSERPLSWIRAWLVAGFLVMTWADNARSSDTNPVQAVREAQAKVAKVYGAGGLRGLESYQSGFLISSQGHVLTAWSYVLDVEPIIVVLHDGSRHEASLLGFDPILEIAVLKLDAVTPDYFDLSTAVVLKGGERILAFSNLYGVATGSEAASVQRGVIAVHGPLQLREGAPSLPYRGPVYLIDAMTNNAGAAGGALTNVRGSIAGILGKELRHEATNIWVNYAIPIGEIRESVNAMLSGQQVPTKVAADLKVQVDNPWSLAATGVRLVPNALPQTPPYVESVIPGSLAETAGIQADDLITFVGKTLIRSQSELTQTLKQLPDHDPLVLLVLRNQTLVTIQLAPPK